VEGAGRKAHLDVPVGVVRRALCIPRYPLGIPQVCLLSQGQLGRLTSDVPVGVAAADHGVAAARVLGDAMAAGPPSGTHKSEALRISALRISAQKGPE